MKTSITYVGMDTHKKEHKIAAIFPGQDVIVAMNITKMTECLHAHWRNPAALFSFTDFRGLYM